MSKEKILKVSSAVGLVLVLVMVVLYLANGRSSDENVLIIEDLSQSTAEISPEEESGENTDPEFIYVDIKGAVNKPGVYKLDYASRMVDLIELAGGLSPDAEDKIINQAQILQDQMMVYIYTKDEVIQASEEVLTPNIDNTMGELNTINSPENNQADQSLININQASQTELESLPGIGPKKAQAIIDHRESYGSFQTKESLMDVSGIGGKTYEGLVDYIRVD